MKIAIWVHMLGVGGAERVMATLAAEFVRQGHEVDIYVHHSTDDYTAELYGSVRVHVLENKCRGLGPLQKLAGLWNFVGIIRRDKPDIIFTTGYVFNAAAVLAARLARLKSPVVIRETSTPSNQLKAGQGGRIKRLGIWLSLRFYKYADRIIVSSAAMQDDLDLVVSGIAGKCRIIPNPLDRDWIRTQSRADLPPSFPAQRPFIMAAGRLIPLKGFTNLVDAWLTLRKECDVDLLILGAGPERDRLSEQVRAAGAEASFHLPGFDTNPYRYMARARLFVLSSHFEGMPNVLLQAMACGCPVISTDCAGASREILEDGALGGLVPVDNVRALSTAMADMLESPIRGQAIENALQKYDKDKVAKTYLQVFETVLEETRNASKNR